jgi:hypothetical protein
LFKQDVDPLLCELADMASEYAMVTSLVLNAEQLVLEIRVMARVIQRQAPDRDLAH